MAKMHRAQWKGYLRLSLVSIGVEIYTAVESKSDIQFRQIHKPSGRRVNYEKVVKGVGKIESDDIVKGYEVDADTYVILEPEEIDALKLESKKTIDLVQFADSSDIDFRYFERPYFVAPADSLAAEGYVVIRDALRETGKVGLSQVTIGGREWLVAIAPLEDGLVMEMLRYADELRRPSDFFEEVPSTMPEREMVDLAVQLINKKTAPFEATKFEDHYKTALKQLIQEKMKGTSVVAPAEEPRPQGANVIDLMEALKRSVGQAAPGQSAAPRAATAKATTPRAKKAPTAPAKPSRSKKGA